MGQILGVRLLLLDVTPEGGEEDQTRLHRFYAAMGFKPLCLAARSGCSSPLVPSLLSSQVGEGSEPQRPEACP